MPRRAYTLIELFLVIFVGSLILAVALPFFRPDAVTAAQSVSDSLHRLEVAKHAYAERHSLAAGTPVTLSELRRDGVLSVTPLAPEGTEFSVEPVGEPVALHLRK